MRNRKREPASPKRITIYLSSQEHDQIFEAFANTTCKSIGVYCKKLVMGKPLTVYYRDRSYDEFTEAFIEFRKNIATMLEKEGLKEEEKYQIIDGLQNIQQIVNKIYDHVRENSSWQKHT